jgi:hypothetical protein
MRARISRALVRWVSGWIGTAYYANCSRLRRVESASAWFGRNIQRATFPIARRLDRNAMTDQMVNEGWWG